MIGRVVLVILKCCLTVASLHCYRTLYPQQVVPLAQHEELPNKGVFALGFFASLVTLASLYSRGSRTKPECCFEVELLRSLVQTRATLRGLPRTALADLAVSHQGNTCDPDGVLSSKSDEIVRCGTSV